MLLPIIKLIYNISITGHTRYEAAKRLGMEKIPCIIADDFSKVLKRMKNYLGAII